MNMYIPGHIDSFDNYYKPDFNVFFLVNGTLVLNTFVAQKKKMKILFLMAIYNLNNFPSIWKCKKSYPMYNMGGKQATKKILCYLSSTVADQSRVFILCFDISILIPPGGPLCPVRWQRCLIAVYFPHIIYFFFFTGRGANMF